VITRIASISSSCLQAINSTAGFLCSAAAYGSRFLLSVAVELSQPTPFQRAVASLLGRVCTAVGLTALTSRITNFASRVLRSDAFIEIALALVPAAAVGAAIAIYI